MDTVPRRGRRRGGRAAWITSAVLVAAVSVGVAVAAVSQRGHNEAPVATLPSSTPDAARDARGCVGGSPVTARSLLDARTSVGADAVGAAEFAATLARWYGTDPGPRDVDELRDTIAAIQAPTATPALVASYEEAVDRAQQGLLADDWTNTTVDGAYYIEAATDAQVTVSVLAHRVSASGTTQAGVMTFTLTRGAGGWQVQDLTSARTSAELAQIAVAYVGGCAA